MATDETPAVAAETPTFVSAETNLLRLPFFALHTTGLRTLDGFSASGEDKDRQTGATYRFNVRTTRNTATHYPGPLSRSVHLALLSILTDNGYQNPVCFGWRELGRILGTSMSGRVERNIKAALVATKGVLIHSDNAIYSRPQGRPICTQEAALSLYDRVTFQGQRLPDGVAAENSVWFAEWYLENLRHRYAAPLNYGMWKTLDAKSGIASRLYEYLLRAFYVGQEVYTVKYKTLAPFLPVRLMIYQSQAQEQLNPAFELLTLHRLVQKVEWTTSATGDQMLKIRRGALLNPNDKTNQKTDIETTIEIRELRNVKPPEWSLAAEFHRLWHGNENPAPNRKDQEQAKSLIKLYGEQGAKALLPEVLNKLRKEWPEAKTLAAVLKYAPDIHNQLETARLKDERLKREAAERRKPDPAREEEGAMQRAWEPVWNRLPADERKVIEMTVATAHPFAKNIPIFFKMLCLRELSARRPV